MPKSSSKGNEKKSAASKANAKPKAAKPKSATPKVSSSKAAAKPKSTDKKTKKSTENKGSAEPVDAETKDLEERLAEQLHAASRSRYDVPSSPLTAISTNDKILGLIYGSVLGDCIGNLMCKAKSKITPINDIKEQKVLEWTDTSDQLLLMLQTFTVRGGMSAFDFVGRLASWAKQLKKMKRGIKDIITSDVVNDAEYAVKNVEIATKYEEKYKKGKNPQRSYSNGAIKRTAVCGIFGSWDDAAVTQCMSTHTSNGCIASCLIISACVRNIILGHRFHVGEVASEIMNMVIQSGKLTEEKHVKEMIVYTSHNMCENLEQINLGGDDKKEWSSTFKCMAAGLWGLHRAIVVEGKAEAVDVFKSIIFDIANEGGDANSNCAVAGALVGCLVGYKNLPREWIAKLGKNRYLYGQSIELLKSLHLIEVINDPNLPVGSGPPGGDPRYAAESGSATKSRTVESGSPAANGSGTEKTEEKK